MLFPNKVIFEGKKARDKIGWLISKCYQIWLAFVVVAFLKMYRKYIKDIKHFGIYFVIVIPMCYCWQWILTQSIDIFPCWIFWKQNILFQYPILGMAFEDLVLFHPFGQIFGYILLVKLKVFETQNAPKNNLVISTIFFMALFYLLSLPAIFIDYSSAISFIMFAIGGTMLIFLFLNEINIVQFIKFFVIITVMSILMDWSCVTLPIWLGYPEAQGWAYRYGNTFSEYLSDRSWMWLFGNQPLSILIVYPWSYMLWMTGLFLLIKKLLGGSSARS